MSNFVITTAGLAAAAAASPTGPYVHITEFRLGSDFSTAALAAQTGLIGSLVYSGPPASYSYYDETTIQINCEVPAGAGPFDYGEIGLFMSDGTMFARFSYGALRRKSESSGSGYTNTLRIKALLGLAAGPSIFTFSPGVVQTVLELSSLQILNTPADNPANPVVIVHEPNDFQESLLCYKHSATLWDIANYTKIGTTTVSAASDNTHLTAPLFGLLYLPASNLGKYVIQTTGGYMRTISGLSGNIATLASSIVTSPLIGTEVAVYQLDTTKISELTAAIGLLQGQVTGLGSTLSAVRSVIAGSIMVWGGGAAPSGYLECNGAAVSRATYAALFSAIGSTWGAGDGVTTFNLPDFRGEFLRGWDHGRGVDAGRALASAQADELKAHTHGNVPSLQSDIDRGNMSSSFSVDNMGVTASSGGAETRPRNVAVMYCIKT